MFSPSPSITLTLPCRQRQQPPKLFLHICHLPLQCTLCRETLVTLRLLSNNQRLPPAMSWHMRPFALMPGIKMAPNLMLSFTHTPCSNQTQLTCSWNSPGILRSGAWINGPPCLILCILQAHQIFFNISTNNLLSFLCTWCPRLYFHMVLSNTHFLHFIIVHAQPLSHSASQMEESSIPHCCGLLYMPTLCPWVPLRTYSSRNSWEHTSNPFHVYQRYLIMENFMNEVLSAAAIGS